jgi:FixJ family two-component response regulator
LDVKMQGMDGLEALAKLKQLDPRAQVVMISGHGTIQTAVEATQLGAYDFLEKPLDTDRILLTLRNALQVVDLASENVRLKAEVHAQYEIVGSSKGVRQVIALIEKAGLPREQAYKAVQRNAMKSWDTGIHFRTLIETDKDITSRLDKKNLDAVFDYSPYLAHVDEVFARASL